MALSCAGLLLAAALTTLTARAVGSAAPDVVLPDGGRYYGALVDGRLQGKGRLEWDNGERYEGGFDKGRMSGAGRYQGATGDIYEGNFKDGLFDGKGKLIGRNEQYAGDFSKGQYAGYGELKMEGGRKYQGQFAANRYQGKGRFENADGDVYEGEFDQGEFSGSGIYKSRDGAQHEGGFLKWVPNGPGKYTDARGNVYAGSFSNGELNGPGTWHDKKGNRYEGGFKGWRFAGQGNYHYANGDEYKGGFASGLFEGEGVFTYASPQKDGRSRDSGKWHLGSLDGKTKANQTPANVETALYNQRALLDKAYAALLPREAGRINMYLLAVGGDGSQEVFRRETEFVRKQFDRDYGTQGRSMILTNSRNTVNDYPMATLTSIRESLKTIAARMDKEQDILFLYLTSHGSKTHEFSIGQNGMDLPNLPAAELGKLLKESGIRWKVVVVSACYSGGFIAPLKDERTLIITAARADRTSFGCADENDFTYFGRAFFKESLPGAKSFDDAFANARVLVSKWEKEEGEELQSEPQIASPKAIRDYLQRWWAQVKGTEAAAAGK
ncbi:MAG: peptidase C13 [Proteobacteria bacterium]|nr:peptidase C13 [Pseudomonadota bacterium]